MKVLAVLIALCATMVLAASFEAISLDDPGPVQAEVTSVVRSQFPYVKLELAPLEADAREENRGSVSATPVYSLDRSGAVDFAHPATIDNLEAYYLSPGDRVQAVMLNTTKDDGTRYITRINRLNEGTSETMPASGVRTERTNYALGAPVEITFVVENRTNSPMTLRFSSSQLYDIWVERDGREVWRWSRGRAFAQAFTSLTLAPGERRVFTETWKQVDNQGERVAPGSYSIFAQLTTVQPRPTPVRTTLTVGTAQAVVQPTTVSAILENVNAALGKQVQLTGTFRGWRPDPDAPACRPGPPVTRSDWAISDGTGCIFATGRSGLDPVSDIGKRITVGGIVRQTDKGQPYIEARNVILAE